jgi:hypothetical protein
MKSASPSTNGTHSTKSKNAATKRQQPQKKFSPQENRLNSKMYGLAINSISSTLKSGQFSANFLQINNFFAQLTGDPGPALLLSYIIYWLLPKKFKEDDDGRPEYSKLPRSGKSHPDGKHWMYNSYTQLSEELSYSRWKIIRWMTHLKQLGFVETKRAFAEGVQQLHFRIRLEPLLRAMIKLHGQDVVETLEAFVNDDQPGAVEFNDLVEELGHEAYRERKSQRAKLHLFNGQK